MPTPKSWTAHDLQLGKLTITRLDDSLQIERRYTFLDSSRQPLTAIAGNRVVAIIQLTALPDTIKDALQQIDTWTKQQALTQENMA